MIVLGTINEAGLARVASHATKPFAIITAFRSDHTPAQNRKRNQELLRSLSALRAGPLALVGHWAEAPDGMDYATAKQRGLTHDVTEDSYFVPRPRGTDQAQFEETILGLARRYQQDAVVMRNDDGVVELVFSSGGRERIASALSWGKVAQAYSRLRKRPQIPFVFEGTRHPTGVLSRQAFTAVGLDWIREGIADSMLNDAIVLQRRLG